MMTQEQIKQLKRILFEGIAKYTFEKVRLEMLERWLDNYSLGENFHEFYSKIAEKVEYPPLVEFMNSIGTIPPNTARTSNDERIARIIEVWAIDSAHTHEVDGEIADALKAWEEERGYFDTSDFWAFYSFYLSMTKKQKDNSATAEI